MKRFIAIVFLAPSFCCTAQWTELGTNIGMATSVMAPGKHSRADVFVYPKDYRHLFALAGSLRAMRTLDSIWQVGVGLDVYDLGYEGQRYVRRYANGEPIFTTKHVVAPPLSSALMLVNRRWNGSKGYGYAGVALGHSWANSLVKTRGAVGGIQLGYKMGLDNRWYVGVEASARYSFLRFIDISYIEPDVDATLPTIHYGLSAMVCRIVGRR